MRVALVFAALAVALVCARQPLAQRDIGETRRPVDFAPAFRANQEYFYDWDSQLASGINGAFQHAIQRMRAHVRLAFTSENTAVVQLKNIEALRLNDHTSVAPTQLIPLPALQKVTIAPRHIESLERPFEIGYKQGKITELIFDGDDEVWSENVKRAVMSSLHVNMDEDEAVHSYRINETTIEGVCESLYTIVPSQPCAALERRSVGQRAIKEPAQGAADCVQVTKSIDFKRCTHRPELRYNYFRGEQLTTRQGAESAQREQRTLASSTFTQTELMAPQNDGRSIVRFARTISQYAQPLVEEAAMNAIAVVELKLKHVKAQQSDDKIPTPSSRKSPQMLAHSLDFDVARERFIGAGNEAVLSQQPYLLERQVMEVLVNLVKKLAQSFVLERAESSRIDWDGAQQFSYLVNMFRHTNATELRELERRLLGDEVEQKEQREQGKPRVLPKGSEWLKGAEEIVEQMLVDAYASAATHVTIKRLYERIVERISRAPERRLPIDDDRRVAETIQKLARTVQFVTPELVRETWKVCENFGARSDSQRSCILAYTRLAHTICSRRNGIATNDDSQFGARSLQIGDEWTVHKRFYAQTAHCTGAIRTELSENIRKLLDGAKDDMEQRVLALKGFGNLGLDVTIPTLEAIIVDQSRPRLERTLAIDALRNIAPGAAHKVRRLLAPIFADKREHPEVRMFALNQLLAARPDKGTIDQIGATMLREPNANVRAFTATALRNAAKILKLIDPQTAKAMTATAQLSRSSGAESTTAQTRRAASRWAAWPVADAFVRAAAMVSNDSRIPKELWAALDIVASGHFEPAFAQIGAHQQNVEELISRAIERLGEQRANSHDIFVRRAPRSTMERIIKSPVDTLKSMYDRLRIVARSYVSGKSRDEQPALIIYRRERNMDAWYTLFDEKNLPEPLKNLIADGQIDLSAAETGGTRAIRWTDAALLIDQTLKTPTIAGVPLVFTLNVAKVSAMNGEWSMEMGARAAGAASDEGVEQLRATLRTIPKISVRSLYQLEAFSPLHNTGVRTLHTIDAQAPIDITAEYTPTEGLQIDWQLPDAMAGGSPHRVLHAASHTATIYRAWPERSRVYVEPEERTIFLPQLDAAYTPMEREWRDPLSGVRVETRGHVHAARSPLAIFYGEHVLDVHVHVDQRSTAKTMRFGLRATRSRIADNERRQLPTAKHLARIFDNEQRARSLFAGAEQEQKTLRERLARIETAAGLKNDVELRVRAIERTSNEPRGEFRAAITTICDAQAVVCSSNASASADFTATKWMASGVAHRAALTLSGLYGSVRSEHTLAHAEAQWGAETANEKNTLVACIYARPSSRAVRRWLSYKDAAVSPAQSNDGDKAEAEERERMAFAQAPALLEASRLTAIVEHQFAPDTQRTIRPLVFYAQTMLSPQRSLLTELVSKTSAPMSSPTDDAENQSQQRASGSTMRAHGVVKIDVEMVDRALRVQVNDATEYARRVPAFGSRGASSWMSLVDIDDSADTDFERRNPSERRQGGSFFDSGNENFDDKKAANRDEHKNEQRRADNYDLDTQHTRRSSSRSLRQFERTSDDQGAQCMIDNKFDVDSFDGKRYKIPLSTCWTVLSMGCGSQKPKYAVLAKKQSESNAALKIKLIVPRHTFVMYEEDEAMKIEVNGKQIQEADFEKYWIHKITETGRTIYVLRCHHNGMELRFDGRRAAIKMGDDMLNEQCGVCGHYNLDAEDTLRKHDNTLASSLKEFHASYLWRGDGEQGEANAECSPAEQKRFDDADEASYRRRAKFSRASNERDSDELVDDMERKSRKMHESDGAVDRDDDRKATETSGGQRSRSDWEQSNEEADENRERESEFELIEPRLETRVHEEPTLICLSAQPFKTCPRGTTPVTKREQRPTEEDEQKANMAFVCFERSSEASRLKRQVREQRVVDMSSYKANKMLPVFEATKCSRQSNFANSAAIFV